MQTHVSSLRIEQELPAKQDLVSGNRGWLIVFIAILAAMPLSFLGFLIFLADGDILILISPILFGLLIMAALLLFVPTRFRVSVDYSSRMVVLTRQYWLGFGALERNREKTWAFSDITDANLIANRLIEIEANGKKVLALNFGRNTKDAQRAYNVLQSWRKGLAPDSVEATTILNELASQKHNQGALKNAEKLLNYFGVFSLIGGAMSFFTDNMVNSTISIPTMISIFTGLIYLACGYGVKRRFEFALWAAIIVVLAERLYWFIVSGTLSGDGNWASWLTWVFAIFVISSLWQAIRSIRTMEENPTYEPLA